MIFGVMIQFDGIVGVGKILQIMFFYYLFISFLNIEIDLNKIVGNYNQFGYYQVLLQNFLQQVVDVCFIINVDGIYIECDNLGVKNGGVCLMLSVMVNQKLILCGDVLVFIMLNYQLQVLVMVLLFDLVKVGKGVMIVGKLYGQFVLIFICVGVVNFDLMVGFLVVDDEFGIFIMVLVGNIVQGL